MKMIISTFQPYFCTHFHVLNSNNILFHEDEVITNVMQNLNNMWVLSEESLSVIFRRSLHAFDNMQSLTGSFLWKHPRTTTYICN